VKDTGYRAEINQSVQHPPAFASEADDPLLGGRYGKGDHQDKPKKTHGDIRPFGNVDGDFLKVESLQGQDINSQMGEGIEECKQAEHSPEAGEPGPSGQLAERRDAERKDKKPQDPVPSSVGNGLDGIRAEIICDEYAPQQQEKRDQAQQEDDRLGDSDQ